MIKSKFYLIRLKHASIPELFYRVKQALFILRLKRLKEIRQKSRAVALFFLAFFPIVLLITTYRTSDASDVVELTQEKETYITRFLHPLPQEVRFKGVAYRFPLKECFIVSAPAKGLEKQIIDDFRARREIRSGTPLNQGPGRLVIKAGLINTMPDIQEAVERGLINVKYLSERPNPEQAYVIAMEDKSEGGVNVYVTANDLPGLYYGLLTLDQLTTPLSDKDSLVLPHVSIVDWPDIRLRGTWTLLRHIGSDDDALEAYDDTLRKFSLYKLNLVEAWHINVPDPKDDGPISAAWVFPKAVIDMGKHYAVQVIPGTGHLPKKFRSESLRKRFPGAPGIQHKKEQKTLHLCQSHPDTREFYTQFLTSIARQYDLADIWMSEIEGPRGVCHCPKCRGNSREAFVKEAQNLMHAYSEARKVNPKFRIILGLTQGSYPHHFSMLEHIPKDVILNFYNGKMTYKAHFQTYNLPPSVMEFQRLGYTVGSTPSPIDTQMMIPFQTPQYCRLLCGEAEDRHMDFVMAQFWPNPFKHDLNAQALAEFLWNSSGRTAEEFTIAWATRKGWDNPEEAAAIILMLEYPSRGIHNCRAKDMVDKIVAYLKGKEWAKKLAGYLKGEEWPGTSVYGKFEYPTRHEMIRIRELCEEAVERAERLHNMELLDGSRLLKHWATILERYSLCLERPDPDVKQAAIDQIKAEFKALPKAHREWLYHKNLSDYGKRYTQLWFEGLQKRWEPVLTDENR